MNLILIEQASAQAGIAWIRDGKSVAHMAWEASRQQRQRMPVALADFFREQSLPPHDVNRFVIDIGPGSFAGIRASLALALGLAAPDAIPVCGISSAEVIAGTELTEDGVTTLAVVGDARRGRLWVAKLEGTREAFRVVLPPSLCTPEETLACVKDANRLVSPDRDRLAPNLVASIAATGVTIDTTAAHPTVEGLAAVTIQYLDSPDRFQPAAPLYLHPPVFTEPRFPHAGKGAARQ